MDRTAVIKRVGDLLDEQCGVCTRRKKTCTGCEVDTELRSLGDRLLELSRTKRADGNKNKGMENMTKPVLELNDYIRMSVVEKKSNKEIAEIIGADPQFIYSFRHRHKDQIEKYARQALGKPLGKTEGETIKLKKEAPETKRDSKYEVLEAAVKQLENEKAAWQKRAEKAEKELSQRDDDKEAMRQANIQLANDNKEYREEIDNLTKARMAAESELDRVSEEYTKSAEALRMARDEGAFAQKRLEQQDYELENLRHSFRSVKESMEVLTKENLHLRGLVQIYINKGAC